MDVRGRISTVFVFIIFLFLTGAPLGAEPLGDLQQKAYSFLLSQRDARTGIPDSFVNTDDSALLDQAATYDMALAGLGFLKLKDAQSSARILEFFDKKWQGNGFPNFFDTANGEYGIETTVHLGPNMWVAVLALQYGVETGDSRFYPLARKIALWGAGLNHYEGGRSMGPFSDWAADWPKVFSTESNVVAYVVFRDFFRTETDPETKELFAREMAGIRRFLLKVSFFREGGSLKDISVGYSTLGGITVVSACDTTAMVLLVFSSQELREFFSLNEGDLLTLAREKFLVDVDGMRGFDFTGEASAVRIGRPRMVSLEWTMQMAVALSWIAGRGRNSSDVFDNDGNAVKYLEEAHSLTKEVDKKRILSGDMAFYPYATKDSLQPLPFAPWWKTPAGDPRKCGAMSSTMWRLFQEMDFNPFDILRR